MTGSSFTEKVGHAWLQAAAFTHGALAALPGMGPSQERQELRRARDRYLNQGNLVLDLVADEQDIRGAAA